MFARLQRKLTDKQELRGSRRRLRAWCRPRPSMWSSLTQRSGGGADRDGGNGGDGNGGGDGYA